MLINRASRVLLPCLALACLSSLLGGCNTFGYSPSGSGTSGGALTYASTVDFPQTITLKDISTDETIWSFDIPVGKQVVIRFYDGHNPKNTTRPDLMRWRLFDQGTQYGELDSSIPAPPAINRRLDVTLRKSTDAVTKPDAVPAPEAASK